MTEPEPKGRGCFGAVLLAAILWALLATVACVVFWFGFPV